MLRRLAAFPARHPLFVAALVAAGSVAIANGQCGIYPVASPGGWHVIGRTPLRMFDPSWVPPARLQAGDRVRFRVISADECQRWEEAR